MGDGGGGCRLSQGFKCKIVFILKRNVLFNEKACCATVHSPLCILRLPHLPTKPVSCRLSFPPTLLPFRRARARHVRLRNPIKSTLAHDAVAAVVLHKHHLIIRVGAGLNKHGSVLTSWLTLAGFRQNLNFEFLSSMRFTSLFISTRLEGFTSLFIS